MPRYYFHIENGQPHRDAVGEDLPGDAEAWQEALLATRDIEDVLAPGGTWRLEVQRDRTVFRIEIRTEHFATDPLPYTKR
jgi:uncharacterized protein DUF6894